MACLSKSNFGGINRPSQRGGPINGTLTQHNLRKNINLVNNKLTNRKRLNPRPPLLVNGVNIPPMRSSRGKQKRNRASRGSVEQDNKKLTVDTDTEYARSTQSGGYTDPRVDTDHTSTPGLSESDSSLSDISKRTNTTHPWVD